MSKKIYITDEEADARNKHKFTGTISVSRNQVLLLIGAAMPYALYAIDNGAKDQHRDILNLISEIERVVGEQWDIQHDHKKGKWFQVPAGQMWAEEHGI